MRSIVVMVGIAALASFGCKKKEEPKAATAQPQAVAPAPMPAAMPAQVVVPPVALMPGQPAAVPGQPGQQPNLQAALQQGMQALAGAFGQPGTGAGGQPAAPLVNWKQLEPFLPEKLGDWTAEGVVNGQTGGFGAMQVSTVKRSYKNGTKTARVKIADTSMAALMRMPFSMMAHMNMDSSEGVKKGVTIGGHKGFVDWKKAGSSKSAVLVADRYVVEVRLSEAANADEVVGVAGLINFSGLAAVK